MEYQVQKYNDKKKLRQRNRGHTLWGKDVDDDDVAELQNKLKPKQKLTSKAKNAAVGADMYGNDDEDEGTD